MDVDRLAYFRKRLEELEREIREDMDANPEDSGVVELDSSIGRLSRMDALQNQQMALELKRRQENQLLRIENGLSAWPRASTACAASAKNRLRRLGWRCFPTRSPACAALSFAAKRGDYALGLARHRSHHARA